MTDAVVISTSALNVLFAVAGALIGMTGAAIAVREQFVSRRALLIERDLRDSLGRLERRQGDMSSVEEAIKSQELAVWRIRSYSERRMFFYRLLFGYLALFGLAVAAVWILLKTQDVALPNGVLRWFAIGIAGAAAINIAAYVVTAMRRLVVDSLTVRPLSIPLERVLELPHELELEESVTRWLRSLDFHVSGAPTQSGFDFIARNDETAVLVDLKAVPRLTIEDIDAARGAALRLGGLHGENARVLIAVPAEALSASASAAHVIKVAEELGIEIVSVDVDKNLEAVTSDGLASQTQVA